MQRRAITRGNLVGKGQWAVGSDGRAVFVSCPGCGAIGSLHDRTVASDGCVDPALECLSGCGFAEVVWLQGWADREV